MRLEATGKPDQYKCWLTDDEIEALRRAAGSHRDDLVIQLGGFVGLRAFEIPQVCPKHVKRTPDGDHFRLRVPEGKDTTGSGGKPRDAYLPSDVFPGRAPFADPHPRVALGTPVRAIVLVAVDASEVNRDVRVTAKAVAPATVRSEQHHADTTSAKANRGTVVTTGLILARTRHAIGVPGWLKERNWVAGESQPTNLLGRSPS
ncbi:MULTISPECIES: site-specific integrase [Halorubrum]|nr:MULTISPECIES: site-specific integrase [Halorubrum]